MHSLCAYIKSNHASDYKGSVNNYFSAIKCFENIGHKNQLATAYINLAFMFYQYKEYNEANTYFKKAEQLVLPENNEADLGIIYFNLGGVNEALNNDSIALSYYLKAKRHYINLQDELGLATIDFNMASIQKKANPNDTVFIRENIKTYLRTKEVFKKHNALNYYLISIVNLGIELTQLGDLIKGNLFLVEAEKVAKEIKDLRNLIIIYDKLSVNANLRGNITEESQYLKSYIIYNDSLFKENNSKIINEISTKYETEKKEKENQVLTLENKNKKQVIYFALGGCVLLLGLLFFILRGYKNKQKANKILEDKNLIINQQKAIVEGQHQDITDSIKYAQRIQSAILPPINVWKRILPNSFVLYLPKDILSGDFYWIEETKDHVFVAAADCTGHGVPGALVSIINYNLLNKAVLEKNLTSPSEILDAVNLWLTESLHQTIGESSVKDGMDVSLIAIHKYSGKISFAGANNPIYIISNGILTQIKGDKFPVGAFVDEQLRQFTSKDLEIKKGDCIYLFSDGFADQFGGPDGKKYKYSRFKERLLSLNDFPVSNQVDILREDFLKWKGNHEQVDDVLVIGITF